VVSLVAFPEVDTVLVPAARRPVHPRVVGQDPHVLIVLLLTKLPDVTTSVELSGHVLSSGTPHLTDQEPQLLWRSTVGQVAENVL